MGRKPTERQQEEFLKYLRSGRDEMNLLEHSVSSASTKVDRETRSLAFSREDFDPETGDPVERNWEVSFSAKYGRPTAKDDDVFVACMKLSAVMDFAAPRVEFTRYELCRILGWDDGGKSYKAIDEAFNRLAGVLIVATNYWYDNETKIWVDRKFGVIDDVFLYQREKYDRAKRAAGGKNPKSWFRWSDVMQESFAAGYLRKLDLEVYLSLTNPIARKLYRYLGKHFWRGSRHTIELQELCHEKLGYSPAEKRNPRLRQKIEPAIQELEKKGVYGLSHEFKATYGKCEVVFVTHKTTERKAKLPTNSLLEKLVGLGVERGDALEAVQGLAAERIFEDIEHVEFLAKAGQIKKSKHGLLASMLKSAEAWQRPEGFISSANKKASSERALQIKAEHDAQRRAEEAKRREHEAEEQAAFIAFMASFATDQQREAFEAESLSQNGFLAKQYRAAKKAGDSNLMATYLNAALQAAWKARQKGEAARGQSRAFSQATVQKSTLL